MKYIMKAVDRVRHQGIAETLLLLALVAAVLAPLFQPGFIQTDDGDWMVIRLSAFYQSFRDGQVPVRFLTRLYNSYGYPVANFLYPGFLYVGSFIHVLGFGFIDSVKVILIGSVCASLLLLYKILRKYFDAASSLLGSMAFLFSPYLLYDLYKRGSVGEIFAFLWAVVCLYSIENSRRVLLAAAIAMLIVSHNTMAVLFLPFLVSYQLFIKRSSPWQSLFVALGVSAFFWMPAILEQRYVIFRSVVVSDPHQFFATVIPWLSGGTGSLLALVGILFRKNENTTRDRYFLVLFLGSLFFASPFSSWLWSNEYLTKLVQFPYRFLALATFSGSWLIASLYQKLQSRVLFLIVVMVFWIISLQAVLASITVSDRPDSYYATNEATTTVADEYLPVWVGTKSHKRADERISVIDGSGSVKLQKVTSKRIEAQLQMTEDSVIQVNWLYYPGWGIAVDNQATPIEYKNDAGLMRIRVPAGSHMLLAEFRETVPRLAADCISILSCLYMLWWMVRLSGRRGSV